MTTALPSARLTAHAAFRTDHYAAGLGAKLMRSLQLGPDYYFRNVPRYWQERRRRGLPGFDAGVLWTPLREFGLLNPAPGELPPGIDDVLATLEREGLTITLKPQRFLAICATWWRATSTGPSAVIECGSYEGSTGIALALLAQRNGRQQDVHLFDVFGDGSDLSFQPIDGERQHNEFVIARDQPARLQEIAARHGIADRLHLHVGLFETTFKAFKGALWPVRFAHVDANLYASTLQATAFVKAQIEAGSIVFDDYNGVTDLGARLAINTVFADDARRIRPLHSTSAVLDIG